MLSDMKIKTRLIAMLLLLLLFQLVIAGIDYYASSRTLSSLNEMFNDRFVPVEQLNQIARKTLRNRVAIANGIIQPDGTDKYIQEIDENRTEINRLWDAYMATYLTEEEKVLAQKYAAAREKFVEEGIRPAVAAMKAHDAEALKRIQVQAIRPLYTPVKESLDALIKLQETEALKLYDEARVRESLSHKVSMVLLILGILMGGGFWLFRHSRHQPFGRRVAGSDD